MKDFRIGRGKFYWFLEERWGDVGFFVILISGNRFYFIFVRFFKENLFYFIRKVFDCWEFWGEIVGIYEVYLVIIKVKDKERRDKLFINGLFLDVINIDWEKVLGK